jgi:glycosyltransferase involved in cell wall biosynthesis
MNNYPEISVCIPVWNVEKYITQCLESVLSQTIIEKAEIIIVNDCTPDNSMQVVTEIIDKNPQHKERIHIVNHEKNKGLAAARNTGLQNSQGKYVIQVDSDDWLEPNYLEELYNAAESNNADISGCDYFKEEIDKTTIVKEDLNKSNSDCLKYIITICQGIIWTKLVKRDLFIQNNISWVEGLDMGEDLLICSKLFANARTIANVSKPLYHYRQTNPNSYCNDSTKNQKKIKNLVTVTNNVFEYLSRWSPLYDNELVIMKAKIKAICIFMGNKELRKQAYQIFSESDSKLTSTAKSLKRKFVFFLIAHKMYGLSELVFRLMWR